MGSGNEIESGYLERCIYERPIKVPVRSNFTWFMFLHFSKVYVVVTYQAKPFSNQSIGSLFFSAVFLAILCPPLIDYVPTAQKEAWA